MSRNLVTAAMIVALLWAAAAAAAEKNWTPPGYKLYGQVLSDEFMRANPDLLSITLHGVPPGLNGVYTMFAGSFPDRIGNADDPDDIDVIRKGITIVDPRWNRVNDTVPKFVVLAPMRNASGDNIGLVVYAFKVAERSNRHERQLYARALELRDALAKRIPNYEALFAEAK
ncbi:MAG: hypothetical protein EBZ40_07385 [Gammaproteobacteria bacterium]|nr:hypothetical protein [Gammaproteobacteria bacterium]